MNIDVSTNRALLDERGQFVGEILTHNGGRLTESNNDFGLTDEGLFCFPYIRYFLVKISDTVSTKLDWSTINLDDIGITDTRLTVAAYQKLLEDLIGIVDETKAGTLWTASLEELLSLLDSLNLIVNSVRIQDDVTGISDTIGLVLDSIRKIADQLGLEDTTKTVQEILLKIEDSLDITDLVKIIKSSVIKIAESLNITDLAATTLTFKPKQMRMWLLDKRKTKLITSLTSLVGILDSVEGTPKFGGVHNVSVSDSIYLQTTAATTELAAVLDSLLTTLVIEGTDIESVLDTLKYHLTLTVRKTDTITPGDLVYLALVYRAFVGPD